jgi:hypothetical protein
MAASIRREQAPARLDAATTARTARESVLDQPFQDTAAGRPGRKPLPADPVDSIRLFPYEP